MTQSPRSYEIQGYRVAMPVVVRDAAASVATFLVSSRVARSIVAPEFEVVELFELALALSPEWT